LPVQHAISMMKIVDVNDVCVKLFAAAGKDELLASLPEVFCRGRMRSS